MMNDLLPDPITLVLRLLGVALGLWLIVECWRTVRPAQPVLTEKGRMTYLVWIGWGLVCAYGLSEQMLQHASNGLRVLGTLAILAMSIYVVRMPGGTRYEGDPDEVARRLRGDGE